MRYKKRDTDGVYAICEETMLLTVPPKYKLKYVSGFHKGEEFYITADKLIEEWERVSDTELSTEELLGLHLDKIIEPYPEPKFQMYRPKPKSVLAYEAKDTSGLPMMEEICTDFEDYIADVSSGIVDGVETIKSVKLDNGIKIERMSKRIIFTVTPSVHELFKDTGIQCDEKDIKYGSRGVYMYSRPYIYTVYTIEEYNTLKEILLKNTKDFGYF